MYPYDACSMPTASTSHFKYVSLGEEFLGRLRCSMAGGPPYVWGVRLRV